MIFGNGCCRYPRIVLKITAETTQAGANSIRSNMSRKKAGGQVFAMGKHAAFHGGKNAPRYPA
jgi:hypothetical protein